MNAVVTGGAGFIGRWVVARLLGEGQQVTVLDDFSSGSPGNLKEFADSPGLEVIEGTVTSADDIRRALARRPDTVYHLAAKINVQNSIDRPEESFATDIAGTFNLLEAIRTSGPDPSWPHLVFVSTCMVFAPMSRAQESADKWDALPNSGKKLAAKGIELAVNGKGLHEVSPVCPASPYAGAKLCGEAMVESYARAYGIPVTVLRPFNTYGPYQRVDGEGGVIPVFLNRRLQGLPLHIYGDGTQTRDFLYVEDCAAFITQAGQNRPDPFDRLIGASGEEISINELAYIIAGGKVDIEHVPHIHPQSEIRRLRGDNDKALHKLGWYPRTPLREGLAKTAAWLQERMSE